MTISKWLKYFQELMNRSNKIQKETPDNNQFEVLNKDPINSSEQPENLTSNAPKGVMPRYWPVDESNLSPKKLSTFVDIKKLIAD